MSISMLKGIHRRMLGISKDDQIVAPSGFVGGGEGKPAIVLPGAPDTVAIFDDFLGDVVADQWAHVEGDTGASGGILANQTNGVYRINLSATGAMTPAGVAALTSGTLNWKANQGPGNTSGRLRMGCRIKIPNVQAHGTGTGIGSVFVGFTDLATAEMPIYDTGNATGPISPASNAVGFIWGPRGDTGWVGVSAKGTAGDSGDQSVVLSGTNPVDNRWQVLEVEVSRGIGDTGGTATFFVNGVAKGRIVSPIATITAMTPSVALIGLTADADTSDANQVDIDWINVSAPRDTGV